jgi:hypothetical protein
MLGLKPVENRSWEPWEKVDGGRVKFRGRLLIHASARPDSDGPRFIASLGIRMPHDLPMGVILGSVELYDVVTDSRSPWAEPGQKHWLMRDPKPWLRPIKANGELGLWEWDAVPGGGPVQARRDPPAPPPDQGGVVPVWTV